MTKHKESVRRIGIIYPFANFDSVPSLYNTAILLAQHGYEIDIFTCFDQDYLPPVFTEEQIRLISLFRPMGLFQSRSLGDMLRYPLNKFIKFIQPLRFLYYHKLHPYNYLLGVDPEGLILAFRFTRWSPMPIIYYSLELLFTDEIKNPFTRKRKQRERLLSQRAAFVIIQDEERAELLIKENGLVRERLLCVPNAPSGCGEQKRSTYLREKFGLPPETKIVLHTGSLGEWTGIHHLIASTRDWPENWKLVVHTRYRAEKSWSNYIDRLVALTEPGRVIFSTEPLPQSQYDQIVQSADIGVAFYCEMPGQYTQKNIRHIGLSSGKTAYYLKYGIPVLVNNVEGLRKLVTETSCGEWVDDPTQTTEAVRRMLTCYDQYSVNALNAYHDRLEFSSKFTPVLQALKQLP